VLLRRKLGMLFTFAVAVQTVAIACKGRATHCADYTSGPAAENHRIANISHQQCGLLRKAVNGPCKYHWRVADFNITCGDRDEVSAGSLNPQSREVMVARALGMLWQSREGAEFPSNASYWGLRKREIPLNGNRLESEDFAQGNCGHRCENVFKIIANPTDINPTEYYPGRLQGRKLIAIGSFITIVTECCHEAVGARSEPRNRNEPTIENYFVLLILY